MGRVIGQRRKKKGEKKKGDGYSENHDKIFRTSEEVALSCEKELLYRNEGSVRGR